MKYLLGESDILKGPMMRALQWISVQVLMIYVSNTFRFDNFSQIYEFYKAGYFWGYRSRLADK